MFTSNTHTGAQLVIPEVMLSSERKLHPYLGTVGLCLLLATPLLELQLTEVHDSGSEFVHILLVGLAEAKDVKGFL